MAASIAGLGNSISAFAGGYNTAKQAERNYNQDQQQIGLRERQIGLQESESEQRRKLLKQQMAAQASEEQRRKRLAYYELFLMNSGLGFGTSAGNVPSN